MARDVTGDRGVVKMTSAGDSIGFDPGVIATGFQYIHSGGAAHDYCEIHDENDNVVFSGYTTGADGVITSPAAVSVPVKQLKAKVLSNGTLLAYHKL